MNLYFELLQIPVFSMEDVNKYYSNIDSARSATKRLMKYGLIQKIKNNMYTCISGETNAPIANRFQIASAITPSSYVSHHTAMEYYGITDQVYYDVYVSSATRFSEFEFEGYYYHYVPSRLLVGVEEVKYSGGICVTDKERTLVDIIKDMDKISGMEEVLSMIGGMYHLKENKILEYLGRYDNQFLFQKAGFILWIYKENLGLSEKFFNVCEAKIGKSKRYLTKDNYKGVYNDRWKIVVPADLKQIMKEGEYTDANV